MIDSALRHLLTITLVIAALTVLTLLIQRQIEKRKNLKELIIIVTLNFIITTIGLGLGIWTAYHGFLSEIDRKF